MAGACGCAGRSTISPRRKTAPAFIIPPLNTSSTAVSLASPEHGPGFGFGPGFDEVIHTTCFRRTGFGLSRTTAYRYRDEVLEVLADQAPDLEQTIEAARAFRSRQCLHAQQAPTRPSVPRRTPLRGPDRAVESA